MQGLDRSRYNPVVVLPGEGPLKEALLEENVQVITTSVIKLHRRMFTPGYLISMPFEILKSIRHIKKELAGTKINIVQSNTLAVLLGIFLAKWLKARHVWHVHEIITHPKFISNLYPKILDRYADIVVCNSNATLQNLLVRNQNLNTKLKLIYNGLDPKDYTPIPANRPAYGYTENDIIITLVGRISRLKGHQIMLRVFNELSKDNANLKLLFTGSPVPGQEFYLEEVEQKIAASQLTGQVQILPFQKDLRPIWSMTDIVVSPSTEAESFGLVALEAMFSKIPVVATNMGGFKEVVVNNETGFLFRNKNEAELKAAIEKLIYDPELRMQLGEKGYERATTVFTLTKYIESFEQIYRDFSG